MGKPTGFLDYDRQTSHALDALDRIKDYNEFHISLTKKQQKEQGARCMECGVPFCHSGVFMNGMHSGCPLNNLIPEFNDLIYTDNFEQALERLLMTNNFPEFTGRVCPAPCEAACTCGLNGDPVTIKGNELAVIEYGYEAGLIKAMPPKIRTNKKVAVIGSGPSGLACADLLNKRGHNVTVYEREDRVGGLLMYGIPNMKLEKKFILRKVKIMEDEGVKFITGADVGKSIKADKIISENDAVVLACGASNPRDIIASGRDAQNIFFAVDFLKSTTKSLLDSNLSDGKYISAKNKNVLVIGGGDTGNDCVATAIRHGAKSVLQLEIMPKQPDARSENNPWPQWPKIGKTDYGQEESIAVFGKDPRVYETTVKEFISNDKNQVKKAVTVKLQSVKDKTGKVTMEEVKGSEKTIAVDLVLIAAGFSGCEEYVASDFGVKLTGRATVLTAENTYETGRDKIFTAGDMHRGQSLVVWAIKEGRGAARAVDLKLMGYTNLE